jgi:uncharacterized protein (UPF0548 family)
MNIGGLRFGRLTDAERDRLLDRARGASITYDHEGSTLDPERWAAPGVHGHHVDVGTGDAAFAAAVTALRTWVPHRGIGADVLPEGQPVELGTTVLVILRRGPLFVVVPDRIVAVVDEPRRFAFAYGTLPGHPERGEESYTAELHGDGRVRVTIRVQAGPATLPARAIAPVVRWLQAAALRGYLRAVADHVERHTQGPDERSER